VVTVAPAGNRPLVQLPQAPEVQQALSPMPLLFVSRKARWTGYNLRRLDIGYTGCHALHWSAKSSNILKHKRSMQMIANDVNQEFLTYLRDIVTNILLHGKLQLLSYIRWVSTVDQFCNRRNP